MARLLPDAVATFGPDDRRLRPFLSSFLSITPLLEESAGVDIAELLSQVKGAFSRREFLTIRSNHAWIMGENGDAAGAAGAYADIARELAGVVGETHPDVLAARGRRAIWLSRAGDHLSAIGEYQELIPRFEVTFGVDHVNTFEARGILASFFVEAGDVASAALCYEELLQGLDRVLGADHPKTLEVRECLTNLVA